MYTPMPAATVPSDDSGDDIPGNPENKPILLRAVELILAEPAKIKRETQKLLKKYRSTALLCDKYSKIQNQPRLVNYNEDSGKTLMDCGRHAFADRRVIPGSSAIQNPKSKIQNP